MQLRVLKTKRYFNLVSNSRKSLPFSFVVARTSRLIIASIDAIVAKLFRVEFDEEVFRIPLISHFEHN